MFLQFFYSETFLLDGDIAATGLAFRYCLGNSRGTSGVYFTKSEPHLAQTFEGGSKNVLCFLLGRGLSFFIRVHSLINAAFVCVVKELGFGPVDAALNIGRCVFLSRSFTWL